MGYGDSVRVGEFGRFRLQELGEEMTKRRPLGARVSVQTLDEYADAFTLLALRVKYNEELVIQQQRRVDAPNVSHLVCDLLGWFFDQDTATQDEILVEGRRTFDRHWCASERTPVASPESACASAPSAPSSSLRPPAGGNEGPSSDTRPKT